MPSLGKIEEAVGSIEAALDRMRRGPAYFAIGMYELWATSVHRLVLKALEDGRE